MPAYTYEAGSVELLWQRNATGNNNCDLLRGAVRSRNLLASLRYTNTAFGNASVLATREQRHALSKLSTGTCTELLEPLTGAGRHPFAEHSGCFLRRKTHPSSSVPAGIMETNKYNLTYFMAVNGCMRESAASCETGSFRLRPTGRRLFYDLGCSRYRDSGGISISGGYGSSLPLFQRLYARNCIEFDAMWGWEAHKFDRDEWMRPVPAHVRAKLTFHNEPVTDENVFRTLRSTARPDDFVVMKVDIDSPALEKRLVSTLASTPELVELVDELYFEYHLHVPDHRKATSEHTTPDTIVEALQLMQRLRAAGVRSHFWV